MADLFHPKAVKHDLAFFRNRYSCTLNQSFEKNRIWESKALLLFPLKNCSHEAQLISVDTSIYWQFSEHFFHVALKPPEKRFSGVTQNNGSQFCAYKL